MDCTALRNYLLPGAWAVAGDCGKPSPDLSVDASLNVYLVREGSEQVLVLTGEAAARFDYRTFAPNVRAALSEQGSSK